VPSNNLLAARISVLVTFFIHGLVFATWVSRIPDVQRSLGLSNGELGLALLGVAVGSLISLPASGWLIAHFGSKPITIAASVWFSLSLILPGLASTGAQLLGGLFVFGLAAGAMDVSMNAQGVVVERVARKPMMSGFHAMFSIGGMVGAAAGGLVAKAGMPVQQHFFWAALLLFAAVLAAIRGLMPASADAAPGKKVFRLTPLVAGLGVLTFCFFLSEGAIADWAAVYLTGALGAGPAVAAAGYAVFSGAMALGRLFGDFLRTRFGPVSLVRNGSLLAAAGMALALLSDHILLTLLGFTLVGFGCSIVVPLAFTAAGVLGGGALAAVATAGYFGLFVGPPLIGFAAEAWTLRWALWIVVALIGSGILLARLVQSAEIQRHTVEEEVETGSIRNAG
jgi:MFS family permease